MNPCDLSVGIRRGVILDDPLFGEGRGRELREWLFAAEAAGDVGEDADVDDGAQMGEGEGRIGEPEGIDAGRGGVVCADQLVVQAHVGIKLVGGVGIVSSEAIEEGGIGPQVAVIAGDSDELGEGCAGVWAADGEKAGDFQAAWMGRIVTGSGAVAGDEAAE